MLRHNTSLVNALRVERSEERRYSGRILNELVRWAEKTPTCVNTLVVISASPLQNLATREAANAAEIGIRTIKPIGFGRISPIRKKRVGWPSPPSLSRTSGCAVSGCKWKKFSHARIFFRRYFGTGFGVCKDVSLEQNNQSNDIRRRGWAFRDYRNNNARDGIWRLL